MKAEIIAIGSELLLGQIIDTNSSYIANSLAENGIEVIRTTAVGDDLFQMGEIIKEAIQRSQIVITTGGLGPTEDDLTRESIAQITGRPLAFQPTLMEKIEAHFKRRGYHRMTENNRKQAYIPEGAIVIENPKGTAPGFIVDYPDYVTISIPGVPFEMKYLMEKAVIPYLRDRFQQKSQTIRYKVLRVCGLGDSGVGMQIEDLMKEGNNPSVGTLASLGDLRIRIKAKADTPEEAFRLIDESEKEIRRRLGTLIYGVDEETLHGNTVRALEKINLTLSVIETFTGGIICQKLTSTGSASFLQGLVLPSHVAQKKFLNLDDESFDLLVKTDIQRLAELLAKQVCILYGTDLGLAVVAETLEKQTGEEYRSKTNYALATPKGMVNHEFIIGGESKMIGERASIFAFDMLRKYLFNEGE